jgi:hypothetical protein
VVTARVDTFSAAGNTYPSNPGVVPTPGSAADSTHPVVEVCGEEA